MDDPASSTAEESAPAAPEELPAAGMAAEDAPASMAGDVEDAETTPAEDARAPPGAVNEGAEASPPPAPLDDSVEEEPVGSIEEQSEAVMEDWAQIAEEQEAAARAKAEADAEAEFAALDPSNQADGTTEITDLDNLEEDDDEEMAYENANADANAGFAYVDPGKCPGDDIDDVEAERAAAAAMKKMGVADDEPSLGEDLASPAVAADSLPESNLLALLGYTCFSGTFAVVGGSSSDGAADKLKGFVKPRKSIFMKWQQNAEQLYSKKKVEKEHYIPKVMKTRDAKSWMVQL